MLAEHTRQATADLMAEYGCPLPRTWACRYPLVVEHWMPERDEAQALQLALAELGWNVQCYRGSKGFWTVSAIW